MLRHPTRRALMDMLSSRPGMNKNQISDKLDLNSSLLDHHLAELERIGCIATMESAQDQEVLCFRVEDLALWRNQNTRILFGRSQNRKVAIYIAENPGRTTREIAEVLGLAPTTIRYHLRTLLDHELVHRFQAGRTFVYDPATDLQDWVTEVGAGFERPWER